MTKPKFQKDEKTERSYNTLINYISSNTGGKMPLTIPKFTISQTYLRRYTPRVRDKNINEAIDNEHIIAEIDEKNRPRYALTVAGSQHTRYLYPYRESDIPIFKKRLEEEKQTDHPNENIMEWCREHIKELE